MPANTTLSAPHIPYIKLKFCISYTNVHTCTANGVLLYLKIPSICNTSVLVFSCHCRFRFLGLRFDFLSPSVTVTDYRPYIHTSSYSSVTFSSVLFSWLYHLRLIIHAKVAKRLTSVVFLPVSSFLNAISWLTSGHLFFMPPLLQIWAFGNLNQYKEFTKFDVIFTSQITNCCALGFICRRVTFYHVQAMKASSTCTTSIFIWLEVYKAVLPHYVTQNVTLLFGFKTRVKLFAVCTTDLALKLS